MYIIKNEKYILLPLAYNEFCRDIESLKEREKYDGNIKIERIIDGQTIDNIVEYCNKNNNLLYVIDMRYIISYENKTFRKLLEATNAKILIINIGNNMVESIKEDLKGAYTVVDEKTLSSDANLQMIYEEYRDDIHNIYHKETVAIVYWMKHNVTEENIKGLKPLDSSGVYCNMYINAKRLFTDSDKYCFIIYELICMIVNNDQEIDALVSASRNGAIIANIIGWLLNKKVIHCTHLGPKFSLAASSFYKDIRKNRKYAYIFDFMCLGTEAKLLNTLLSFRGANLVEGYGIANYINLEGVSEHNVFTKMRSLVNVQKEKMGYRIAGTKEEIEGMLAKESKDYVSGLCRV